MLKNTLKPVIINLGEFRSVLDYRIHFGYIIFFVKDNHSVAFVRFKNYNIWISAEVFKSFYHIFVYVIPSWLVVVERFESRLFNRSFQSVDGISSVFINWFFLDIVELFFKRKEKSTIVQFLRLKRKLQAVSKGFRFGIR